MEGMRRAGGMRGVLPRKMSRRRFERFIIAAPAARRRTQVLRVYSTILANLGVASTANPDFKLIGGYGKPEEWLPGCANTVENLEKRAMVQNSPLYDAPALDFDPDQHHVW